MEEQERGAVEDIDVVEDFLTLRRRGWEMTLHLPDVFCWEFSANGAPGGGPRRWRADLYLRGLPAPVCIEGAAAVARVRAAFAAWLAARGRSRGTRKGEGHGQGE